MIILRGRQKKGAGYEIAFVPSLKKFQALLL